MTDKFSELERAMLAGDPLPENVESLEEMLADDGVDLSDPKFQRGLQGRLDPVRERAEHQRQKARTRPKFYDQVRNFALTARDTVALIFAALLMAFLPAVGILFLFLSETLSAGLGAITFLNDGYEQVIAWILSFTLTTFFFSLEWRLAALVHKYGKPKKFRWSIAKLNHWRKYALNYNAELQEVEDSHDLREARSVARWVMGLIVILGVLGRLYDELGEYEDETWYTGFWKAIFESNPQDFLGYLGGALIAWVLLIGTRYILGMVYEQWASIGGDEESFFDLSSVHQELRSVEVRYLQSIVRNRFKNKNRGDKLTQKWEQHLAEMEASETNESSSDQTPESQQ